MPENEEIRNQTTDAAPTALVIVDKAGQILDWQARELLGWPAEEALGRSVDALIVPARHRSRDLDGLRGYGLRGEAGDAPRTFTVTALTRAAGEIPVEVTVGAFREGDALRYLAVMRDVRPQKAEQERLIAEGKLASLTTLATAIAHEIQNPLNFIKNFAEEGTELARELRETVARGDVELSDSTKRALSDLADDLREFTDRVLLHTDRIEEIVRSVLFHGGLQSSKHLLTDVNALVMQSVRAVIERPAAQHPELGIELTDELDPDLPFAFLSPDAVSHVLASVADNACYAARERASSAPGELKPRVEVRTRSGPASVEISVRDNGSGIPEELRDRIFEPFFTTKPPGAGPGLGLAIGHDIVAAHGGSIEVDSVVGEHTEVTISLPLDKRGGDRVV